MRWSRKAWGRQLVSNRSVDNASILWCSLNLVTAAQEWMASVQIPRSLDMILYLRAAFFSSIKNRHSPAAADSSPCQDLLARTSTCALLISSFRVAFGACSSNGLVMRAVSATGSSLSSRSDWPLLETLDTLAIAILALVHGQTWTKHNKTV
jgi:hypothetical protein